MDFYKELCNITGIENVLKDEPMSRHTTFKIGGPADYFITPTGEEEIGSLTHHFYNFPQKPFI